ncbi:MAG: class I SAM-dependent methyltransferase [Bacteroidota bacterium]
MFRLVKFFKGLLIVFPVSLLFAPFNRFFVFLAHFNKLVVWIYRNRKGLICNDFFSFKRNYQKRYRLYAAVLNHYHLTAEPVIYLEFGVASGASFRWWLKENTHEGSLFYGFDTFEGLPENWGGFYSKGDMSHAVPETGDKRAVFIKGLFQDTLNGFIADKRELLLSRSRKLIHMDADLYSATIFTLSQLYPYIKKGDIIIFDEFNVPMHEFKAYLEFTGSFYVKLKPVAAVNNFYQTAFIVE